MDLETQVQGLSRTNTVFKYFQGLKFRQKTSRNFKDAWEPSHRHKKTVPDARETNQTTVLNDASYCPKKQIGNGLWGNRMDT